MVWNTYFFTALLTFAYLCYDFMLKFHVILAPRVQTILTLATF